MSTEMTHEIDETEQVDLVKLSEGVEEVEIGDFDGLEVNSTDDLISHLTTLDEISTEMHRTGKVDKMTRVALEAYDGRSLLPHMNSYTATPSTLNVESTTEFVDSVKVNIGRLSAQAVKESCINKLSRITRKLENMDNKSEATIKAQQFKKSIDYIARMRVETPVTDLLTEESFTELVNVLKGVVDTKGEVPADLPSVLSTVLSDNDISNNLVFITRLHRTLFKQFMQGQLGHISTILTSDFHLFATYVNEIITAVINLKGDDPTLIQPLILSKYAKDSFPRPGFETDVKLAMTFISNDTVETLWAIGEDWPGATPESDNGLYLIKRIMHASESINALGYEGDNEKEDLYAYDLVSTVKANIKQIEDAVDVYVAMTKMYSEFAVLATKFNDEFSKALSVIIDDKVDEDVFS